MELFHPGYVKVRNGKGIATQTGTNFTNLIIAMTSYMVWLKMIAS